MPIYFCEETVIVKMEEEDGFLNNGIVVANAWVIVEASRFEH
jgi:hypothetical protein